MKNKATPNIAKIIIRINSCTDVYFARKYIVRIEIPKKQIEGHSVHKMRILKNKAYGIM